MSEQVGVVCVNEQPFEHHGCEPGDCYCDVWCKHGQMECAECPGFIVEEP